MEKVIVYSNGLCYCSVCAQKDLSVEEITKEVNIINPSGVTNPWQLSEESFADGSSNPHKCNLHPDKRLHYLFIC